MEKRAMSLTDGPSDLVYPKLPVWATVRSSYSSYFHHFIDALRASWLWLIAVALLAAITGWQQWSLAASAMANLETDPSSQMTQSTAMVVLSGLNSIVFLLAGVSIAVAWHRLMILDERPGISGSNVATKELWRYNAVALTLGLITFLPAAAVTVYFLWPLANPASLVPIFVPVMLVVAVLYVAGIAAGLRLVLLLPARAIGNTSLSFGETWNRTRGNIWRLFWGMWLTTIPPTLGVQIVYLAVIGLPHPGGAIDDDFVVRMTALSTIFTTCYLLIVPIGIGFLSLTYRHFFQSPIDFAE
jgi:hypothetical protein